MDSGMDSWGSWFSMWFKNDIQKLVFFVNPNGVFVIPPAKKQVSCIATNRYNRNQNRLVIFYSVTLCSSPFIFRSNNTFVNFREITTTYSHTRRERWDYLGRTQIAMPSSCLVVRSFRRSLTLRAMARRIRMRVPFPMVVMLQLRGGGLIGRGVFNGCGNKCAAADTSSSSGLVIDTISGHANASQA